MEHLIILDAYLVVLIWQDKDKRYSHYKESY
jgi:hypothetical protein